MMFSNGNLNWILGFLTHTIIKPYNYHFKFTSLERFLPQHSRFMILQINFTCLQFNFSCKIVHAPLLIGHHNIALYVVKPLKYHDYICHISESVYEIARKQEKVVIFYKSNISIGAKTCAMKQLFNLDNNVFK